MKAELPTSTSVHRRSRHLTSTLVPRNWADAQLSTAELGSIGLRRRASAPHRAAFRPCRSSLARRGRPGNQSLAIAHEGPAGPRFRRSTPTEQLLVANRPNS